MLKTYVATAAAVIAAMSGAAHAQVILNEVFENPPSSTDSAWEYIELYGVPGTDLTGMAIAVLKGGADDNMDGIPGPIPADSDLEPGDEYPEIDEAFQLDGVIIPANGLVVIYRGGGVLNAMNADPAAAQTVKLSYTARHIPTIDTSGNLANDGSSTYILVRKRPAHSINGSNQSVYAPGYGWRKDVAFDVDFDSLVDCGSETIVTGTNPSLAPGFVSVMEPYQMVDEVSWSNAGGKEYARSDQQEISDTPGFNPDALSRVNYIGRRIPRGWRFNSDAELKPTRQADEEFIYGEVVSVANGADYMRFLTGSVKGPTDPNALGFDGLCDPDMDPLCTANGGPLLFTDIPNLDQYRMSPGVGNTNATVGVTQFTFNTGDFDFDKTANVEDLYLINQRLGATIDDTELRINDNDTPKDLSDDCSYAAWKWEGRNFNAMLAMLKMNTSDNATAVTAADIAAQKALVRASEAGSVATR